MKNTTKRYIIRAVFLILVLAWMGIIFKFSNEPADLSSNTSLGITKRIVEIISKQETSIQEKEQLTEKLDPYMRKLAHFTLYAIGGVLIINFINTYNISEKKKIIYSLITGVIYACSDEFHQLFIEGRSGEITDVMIDSFGVATGACIFLCVINIIDRIIKHKKLDLGEPR